MQMAIVKMSNFSLLAFDAKRDTLLHELQKFEYVHFVNLDEDENLVDGSLSSVDIPESIVAIDEEISKVKYSIDLLSKYSTKESGIKSMIEGKDNYSFTKLEEKALSIDYLPTYEKLRQLSSERDKIDQEMMDISSRKEELINWERLDYPINDLDGFTQSEVMMGTIPKKFKEQFNEDILDLDYTYSEIIKEGREGVYLFLLASKEELDKLSEILRNNSFSSIKLEGQARPKEEINAIDDRLKALELENEKYEGQFKELAGKLSDLEVLYEYLMNKKLRAMSAENFLKTESVNVIKGFIPTDMASEFTKVIEESLDSAYHLEITEADKDDPGVPILLKNSKFVESFESLTAMYALPKYNEIDPTPFLAPFYLIFFGMMAADIGYGLVLLIGTFVVLKTFNLSVATDKFVRFFFYLSFAIIGWGILYGSIFGGIIPMKGLFDPGKDYNILLVISIAFGLIHIYYGLGLQAYLYVKDGKYIDAFFDVGFWYLALTGAIVFLISKVVEISATLANIGLVTMIIGMVGIVATGGREAKGLFGKLGGGIYSLYGISGYIGDFVSYSRLMALGLAGGFIASAINNMANMVVGNGVIGIIGAILIFIGGQIFNFGLTLLSAYVHTIRLTFVEFFGKFYEGGGKSFNSFKNKPKYINLK